MSFLDAGGVCVILCKHDAPINATLDDHNGVHHSFMLKTEDYRPAVDNLKENGVEVKQKSREMPLVLDSVESSEREIPDYIEVDHRQMKGTFLRTPLLADVPYPVQMEPNLVIEFYSR